MWNPEIWQDPPTCGQADLVLSKGLTVLWTRDRAATNKKFNNYLLTFELEKIRGGEVGDEVGHTTA